MHNLNGFHEIYVTNLNKVNKSLTQIINKWLTIKDITFNLSTISSTIYFYRIPDDYY